ncbi:hypothetical protein HETIRDRAFT_421807 [Heterobasidion irregulare TC 32-1]|uniref:Uncharacterized protein n=1 Tax=Heterobasidion irregulare (strain TC 32-1) TaxID=747525 RepID=W4JS92_HETIT|nr:uncharacterized protein HETIRDRAFT_421807 [Heterobasidion irregulare TC 32-1]ETW76314.1 hypothetical protein HETIRDRAFT_421807 [Heterobasidion irregulare TC 32-1]
MCPIGATVVSSRPLLSVYVLSDQYHRIAPVLLRWTTWNLLKTTRPPVQEATSQHETERTGFKEINSKVVNEWIKGSNF